MIWQNISSSSIFGTFFLRILVIELFEGFHPEWEKCTWKKAADTCEKPENHDFESKCKYEKNTNHNVNTSKTANATTNTIGKGTFNYAGRRKKGEPYNAQGGGGGGDHGPKSLSARPTGEGLGRGKTQLGTLRAMRDGWDWMRWTFIPENFCL